MLVSGDVQHTADCTEQGKRRGRHRQHVLRRCEHSRTSEMPHEPRIGAAQSTGLPSLPTGMRARPAEDSADTASRSALPSTQFGGAHRHGALADGRKRTRQRRGKHGARLFVLREGVRGRALCSEGTTAPRFGRGTPTPAGGAMTRALSVADCGAAAARSGAPNMAQAVENGVRVPEQKKAPRRQCNVGFTTLD